MPFTITHCAAAIPLARLSPWRLPWVAMFIGCMVNDLGVFFYEWVDYYALHSISGLFTHCLPIGWLIYLLYHWLLRAPLFRLLPVALAIRLWDAAKQPLHLSARMVVRTSIALVLGAASHLFWDSFTHSGWWGVETFSFLDTVVYDYPDRPIHWFSILQHGSSVVCLPFLSLYGWRQLKRLRPVDSTCAVPTFHWSAKLLAGFILLFVPVCAWLYLLVTYPEAPQYRVIHEAVKLAGTVLIVLGTVYGTLTTLLIRIAASSRSLPIELDNDD